MEGRQKNKTQIGAGATGVQKRYLKKRTKDQGEGKSYREKGQSVRKSRLRGEGKVRHITCSCCRLMFPEFIATWQSFSNKIGRYHSNIHIKTSKATNGERDKERERKRD